MTSNHKLTSVLQGRIIASAQQDGDTLTLGFDDGSAMTVQTASSPTQTVAAGGKIDKVRQQDTALTLDLEGGTSVSLTTAEATSSVMVRDKNRAMEYAD